MGELTKYRVILSGKVIAEYDRKEVLLALADIFNSKIEKMELLLRGKTVPLKKEYDKDQSVQICRKIRSAGAECKIEEIKTAELELIDDTIPINLDNNDPGLDSQPFPGSTVYKSDRDQLDKDEQVQAFAREQADAQDAAHKPTPKQKLQTLLMRYVKVNTDFYRHQFAKFGDPKKPAFKPSWNWPAFFFFFFWALYRKMWGWAGLFMVGGLLLMSIVPSAVLSLVWLFVWPLMANYLYFRNVSAACSVALKDEGQTDRVLAKGGVSRPAVWAGVIVTIFLSMMVSNYIVKKFLEEYGDQIQDVLPGSGSQIRGDGSILDTPVEKSKLAQTSLLMSSLGTSLKVLLVMGDGAEFQLEVGKHVARFKSGKVKDAWGTPIKIEIEPDRYVLISAGPDTAYDNADDLLQPVTLPDNF